MMKVIQLLADPLAEASLARAVRMARTAPRPRALHVASSWDDLARLVAEHPGAVPVLDPYFEGSFDASRVESIARSTASHVIVYASFLDKPVGQHVSQLLAAGVGAVVTRGVDDTPERLAAALDSALGQRQMGPVLDHLKDALSWRTFLFARAAIRAGARRISVHEVAALLGVHPRTVRRWCRREGAGAQRILHWSHLLNAARVISATGAEPRAAANRLGFSRYSHLSRRYREMTGRRLEEEKREDVFAVVAQAFLDEITAENQNQRA